MWTLQEFFQVLLHFVDIRIKGMDIIELSAVWEKNSYVLENGFQTYEF